MARRHAARSGLALLAVAAMLAQFGCAHDRRKAEPPPPPPPRIIVVAPVLNLSGTPDVDTLRVTDWVAAELLEFPGTVVVPVNMGLAALARQGKNRVESPADARALADEFGADATVVTALTEYHPFDPPRVGLIMQWYGTGRGAFGPTMDPVSASRAAVPAMPVADMGPSGPPTIQVQKSFNAADQRVLREVREYADRRDGQPGPYGWRRYTKSQELYVRYCAWSTIRTMLTVHRNQPVETTSDEAEQ
jgi:hypothetical protein